MARTDPAVAAYLASIGAKGGSATSAAKTAAARRNARKGGRPRKPKDCARCEVPTLKRGEYAPYAGKPLCAECVTRLAQQRVPPED